ncbi:MAG: DUF3626 domain-containing protein, partial [Anaerolineae bacterium]|nr:DUF3626 domain-containing protein [Anaerolineae bacterium]
MLLSPLQQKALNHVKHTAKTHHQTAHAEINAIIARAGVDAALVTAATERIQSRGRVALHFHPDRLCNTGQSVAEALLQAGMYRNQFETGISNGGLTAFRGGQRDNWEKRLFDGAYQQLEATTTERPKYGALDVMHNADGPAPRFGSCYFLLKPAVSQRCSFTYQDSYYEPDIFGTIDTLTGLIAAMLRDVEHNGALFGVEGLTVATFLARLATLDYPPVNYADNFGRTLDDYIEAQIHGPIDLKNDVDRLIADPSFQATPTGDLLAQICATYAIDLDWHAGFTLYPHQMPDAFRGPAIPRLAHRIAGDKAITAALIGDAAVSLVR